MIPEIVLFDICYSILLLIYLMLQTSISPVVESIACEKIPSVSIYLFFDFDAHFIPYPFLLLRIH